MMGRWLLCGYMHTRVVNAGPMKAWDVNDFSMDRGRNDGQDGLKRL